MGQYGGDVHTTCSHTPAMDISFMSFAGRHTTAEDRTLGGGQASNTTGGGSSVPLARNTEGTCNRGRTGSGGSGTLMDRED